MAGQKSVDAKGAEEGQERPQRKHDKRIRACRSPRICIGIPPVFFAFLCALCVFALRFESWRQPANGRR